MTLQDRVLSAIAANNPVRSAELEKFLPGLDHIDVDVAVRQLMKANRVTLTAGYYDLVEPVRSPPSKRPFVATVDVVIAQTPAPAAMLTAAEEAALSLQAKKAWCSECKTDHPESEFRKRIDGSPYAFCKKSHGMRMQRARSKDDSHPDTSTPLQPQQERIGAQAPPAISSEHLSTPPAQGTQPPGVRAENPEALSPVFTGSGIAAIGRKRDGLLARRETLQAELQQCTQQLERLDQAVLTLNAIVPEAFQ